MSKANATPLRGPAGDAQAAVDDAAPADDAAVPSSLAGALLDSRQRWRDLVHLAADFTFETNRGGRFVFVAPDPALGWQAATLLGQPGELLLVATDGTTGFNPFRATTPMRRRRAWLKRPDGGSVCLSFNVVPLLDAAGRASGVRGAAFDMSEQEHRDTEVAGALRRGELLNHILWRIRKEVLAPRMMQAALEALAQATGSEGLALLDTLGDGVAPLVLHGVGDAAPAALLTALALLDREAQDPSAGMAPDGRQVLACPTETRFGVAAALVLWREPGGRAWDADERLLVAATVAIIRVILEHDSIQRELARQARTDPLTGLYNRRAFMDELARRIGRLEVDGLPGTLLLVDLDNFKALNDGRGHDAGDEALRLTGKLLRGIVRPMDLVARLGGDEFALWLDGADELAAAERAEQLRIVGPQALAHLATGGLPPLTLSIGIAAHWPGSDADVEQLLQRADQAMYAVKRGGRGHWLVARPGDDP